MALVSYYALTKLRAVCQESYRTRSKLVLFLAKSPTLVVKSDSDCKPRRLARREPSLSPTELPAVFGRNVARGAARSAPFLTLKQSE